MDPFTDTTYLQRIIEYTSKMSPPKTRADSTELKNRTTQRENRIFFRTRKGAWTSRRFRRSGDHVGREWWTVELDRTGNGQGKLHHRQEISGEAWFDG